MPRYDTSMVDQGRSWHISMINLQISSPQYTKVVSEKKRFFFYYLIFFFIQRFFHNFWNFWNLTIFWKVIAQYTKVVNDFLHFFSVYKGRKWCENIISNVFFDKTILFFVLTSWFHVIVIIYGHTHPFTKIWSFLSIKGVIIWGKWLKLLILAENIAVARQQHQLYYIFM